MNIALLLLRTITWAAIIVSYGMIWWLGKQLKRAHRDYREVSNDANHWAITAIHTMATLQKVAPGTPVALPPETLRWMEVNALEAMVYGDHEPTD